MHNMSSDRVKNRSSSSCARRRSTNRPIWLPTLVSIDSRSSSGARISRLKNSMTLWTSPRSRIGKPNARVQSFARGNRRARKIRVADDVGNPGGLRRSPRRGPADRRRGANVVVRLTAIEFGKLTGESAPGVDAAKDVGLAVDPPERAVLPVERFADRLENLRRRFAERGRFDERARRDVLGRQTTLGMRIRARTIEAAAPLADRG